MSIPAAAGPAPSARDGAAALLDAVLGRGRMLGEEALPDGLAPPDRARALGLAGTVLRHLGRIDALLARYVATAPPPRARNALRLAAAELLLLGTPAHAAVDSAVARVGAAPASRHLKGLVNAVARRIAQEGAAVWATLDPAAHALTAEMRARLAAAWGEEAARAMALAHLSDPPLDLTLRDPGSAPLWAERLGAEVLPTGSLRLRAPGRVSGLPGFGEGAWWVQDAAAALPARIAGDVAGCAVLDLCAAPGGKTLQLAAAGARVTALDINPARLARLGENLARTGLAATSVAADAFAWGPEGKFDLVLVDAPCSATGTMRRHPDLPHRPAEVDLRALTRLQDGLLARAAQWLRPGGRLVFATCSLLPEEGEERVARFLARHPGARVEPPAPLPGLDPAWVQDGCLRLRPDFWAERGGMDGFFAAVIRPAGDSAAPAG